MRRNQARSRTDCSIIKMIDINTYEKLRRDYGSCSSWAIWTDEGDTPKSNTSDLSIFDDEGLLERLNSDYIFVGLNVSSNPRDETWSNFHSRRSAQNDYKIRFALRGTRFYGSYMTDVIKHYPEVCSSNVRKNLKNGLIDLRKNYDMLRNEINILGNPTIIAFGNDAFGLLLDEFSDMTVVKIPHYSMFISKEKYRNRCLDILKDC